MLLSIKVTFNMQSGVVVIHFFCRVAPRWPARHAARAQSAFYPHYSISRKTQSRPRTWQPRQIYILIVFFPWGYRNSLRAGVGQRATVRVLS